MAIEWKDVEYKTAPLEGAFRDVEEVWNKDPTKQNLVQSSAMMSPEDYFSAKQGESMFQFLNDSMTAQEARFKELEDRIFNWQSSNQDMMQSFIDNHNSLMELLNSKYPTQYQTDNATTSSQINTSTGTGTVEGFGKERQTVYDTLRTKLSHKQAMAVMANIHSENGFQDKYIYGSHIDGQKKAYGLLSWQGGRETELLSRLSKAGYMNTDGSMKQDVGALKIQAEYLLDELSRSSNMQSWLNNDSGSIVDLATSFDKGFVRSGAWSKDKAKASKIMATRKQNYIAYQNMGFSEKQSAKLAKANEPSVVKPSGKSTAEVYLAKDNKELMNTVYDPKKMTFGIEGFGSIFLNGHTMQNSISSGYGYRGTVRTKHNGKSSTGSQHHAGYDIRASIGTKLTSPFANATVIASGYDKNGGGNYISLRDDVTGNVVQLMHLDKVNVIKGQKVKAGSFIGTSGNSGNSSGAHIDIRVYNKWGEYLTYNGKTAAKTGNLAYVNKQYRGSYK